MNLQQPLAAPMVLAVPGMYKERQISKTVFRAYDIRGIIGEELDGDAYYTIGRALAIELRAIDRNQIFIARDGRLTSIELATALIQGLIASGINVIDLGSGPTPMMYYATHKHAIDCGLMVTGSHNPSNYNGIKIVIAGKTLVKADIDRLYAHVIAQKFHNAIATITYLDIKPDYIRRIVNDIILQRALTVVVDCGNGIAGTLAVPVLERLGCSVIPLFCEIDGTFPNHHPDPSVEHNLADLQQAVLHHKADIGLAFDGDGDRLGVITDKAEIIWPDRLIMYYATHLKLTGATIVFDVKCSANLATVILNAGGIPKMCPTGHSIVKGVMREENAALAGEMSGHIFFKDRWYGFDDAIYSACRLLELVSQTSLAVSWQFKQIPDSINTPEIKIPIHEDNKFDFMQKFCELANFPGGTKIMIDGIRVEFDYGWGLIRASNTTPCLVARFEATDPSKLSDIQNLFKDEMQRIQSDLQVIF